MFSLRCRQNGIEHRLTKPDHPWTNGQVERMNRTLKGATVKRYHYESHNQARGHLAAFLAAYNFAKRLKTLRGKPTFFARTLYKARSRIEQGFGRLKRFKRIALRCEKTARNFRSIVSFAAGLCLIKFVHTA